MSLLGLIPSKYKLGAEILTVFVVVTVSALAAHHYVSGLCEEARTSGLNAGRLEAATIQQRWDADKQAWQASTIKALQAAKDDAQRVSAENERITREKDKTIAALRADAGSSRAELAGLRDDLQALTATATGRGAGDQSTSVAGLREAIGTLGELFLRSGQEYQSLAEQADSARAAGAECEQRYDALTK